MSVVADTSIWIDYLRKGAAGPASRLDDLMNTGQVMVCGPVVAEILAGASAVDRPVLGQLLSSLPWAELGRSQWRRVGETAAALRARGLSVPLTDIEIAVATADANADLWTRDSDFQRIGSVVPGLRLFEP